MNLLCAQVFMNCRGGDFSVAHRQDDRSAAAREIAAGEDTSTGRAQMIAHFS
jgi:hypothetical protein